MEKMIQEIKDNTTFVISGHNIKWFGVLAVESLIARCNVKREQAVYFDDFSTDGTTEEMHKRGIKTISWDKETYDAFIKSTLKEDLPVRVSQIITSAIKQTKTKYMCALDGDAFHVTDTIDLMLPYIKDCINKYGLFGVFGVTRTKEAFTPSPYHEIGVSLYQGILYLNVNLLKTYDIPGERLIDILELKEKCGDECFNEHYDTGNCLYNEIIAKNIPLITIPMLSNNFNSMTSHHVGSLSSLMRKDVYGGGNMEFHIGNISSLLWGQEFKELCSELNINTQMILTDILSKIRKSPSY